MSDDDFLAIARPIIESGGSWKDVAAKVGCGRDTARVWGDRAGLRSPRYKDHYKRMPMPEGWPGWKNATRDQRGAAVTAGLAQNLSRTAIAIALGVNKNTILAWLGELKVPPRKPRKRRTATAATRAKPGPKGMSAEKAKEVADKMRKLVAQGFTIKEAGEQCGIGRHRAYRLAKQFGIRLSQTQVREAQVRGGYKGRAGQIETTAANRVMRNPKLSLAQQRVADALKESTWQRVDYRLLALPRVTDDEAARLIADHIARRGITQCPPPVEMLEPVNWGVGWGARKPR